MTIQLSQRDKAIFEELAIAIYHDTQGLHDLFSPDVKSTRNSRLSKRLRELTQAGYLLRTKYRDYAFLGTYVYYLGKKGIDVLDVDPAIHNRLYNHSRATKELKGPTLRHNVLRSTFRISMLKSGQLNKWIQEQRGFPITGEFDHPSLGTITKDVNPDAFFTLGGTHHYFLEVDMRTESVRASTSKRLGAIEKKLRLYNSLLADTDRDGARWRLAPLRINYFKLLFLKKSSHSKNEHLNTQPFETIRALLSEPEFSHIRKAMLFLHEDSLTNGSPILAEDFAGKSVPLAA